MREDAPDDLRYAVAAIARSASLTPSKIRDTVCQVVLVSPNRNNWSEYPNIWDEVLYLLNGCEWFKVYDVAEALWRNLEYDCDWQTRSAAQPAEAARRRCSCSKSRRTT